MRPDHQPVPPARPVSDADRSLRENLLELAVHVRCGGIRGTIGFVWSRCGCAANDGIWQSCGCEDEPVRWVGCDVSQEVALCVLCARGTAGGPSRWAWVGCSSCRDAADELRIPLPLGRHSIMNDARVRLAATGRDLANQQRTLLESHHQQLRLGDWSSGEVRRLANAAGWAADTQVLLRTWQERYPAATAASMDAIHRYVAPRPPMKP